MTALYHPGNRVWDMPRSAHSGRVQTVATVRTSKQSRWVPREMLFAIAIKHQTGAWYGQYHFDLDEGRNDGISCISPHTYINLNFQTFFKISNYFSLSVAESGISSRERKYLSTRLNYCKSNFAYFAHLSIKSRTFNINWLIKHL